MVKITNFDNNKKWKRFGIIQNAELTVMLLIGHVANELHLASFALGQRDLVWL